MNHLLKIVALGDSMTEAAQVDPAKRWPTMLERRLQEALSPRDVSIINAGVGGNTSREGLRRIEQDVLAHQPDWVLVEFGGNDGTSDQMRNVPLEEFRQNLKKIWEQAITIGSKVALISFPPVVDVWHGWIMNEEQRKLYNPQGGLDAAIHPYRLAVEILAQEQKCLFIDWYHNIRIAMERDGYGLYILNDGIHFTEKGNKLACEIVWKSLQKFLK